LWLQTTLLRNARVLLSSTFRYFGKSTEPIPKHLQEFAEKIRRGHRVNHDPVEYNALANLVEALCRKHTGKKKPGEPDSAPNASACCSRDGGSACVD
jgi:hypothetical protein